MKLALVLSFVGLVQYGGAQIVQDELCNSDVQLQPDFDADKFVGQWYEIKRSASQSGDDCATIHITKNAVASGYSFTYSGVIRNLIKTSGDVATLEDGTAKFGLNLNGTDNTDFWILKTDYDSYALAYRCNNISPSQRSVSLWILGREKAVAAEVENELRATLDSQLQIDIEHLETVDNSARACVVLPMTRNEVILPGQCNPYIPAEANFDANRFQGVWYEVASYYSANALGTCNRAQYTLVGDVVDVVNSQVVDQRLEEIKGTAKVNSDDGRGELLVTLEVIPGFFAEQLLWILATNYEEWAVSYSCVNVTDTTKRVNSWILTRTKTPSEESLRDVTKVIDLYEDLVAENFLSSDQSDDACFYKPEHRPGVPVVFPGHCKDVPVVDNFNLALFAGAWNEMEAYPKEQQGGQCIRHQFQTGTGNTLNLQTTSVYDIFRDTTGGVLSFSSTDNSAKMTITTDNGIEIPFWILSTDYQTYTLAYSCVNKAENYRAVYSWILTRNGQQLTPQAIAQINDVFSNVEVLDRIYLEPIDQSAAGCSYLTDLAPGEPVIVPRLCPLDIDVHKNFDAGRYLGRWNLIASYPSMFQGGKCNQATYSLLDDGSVMVFNTQVKDQTLETDTGNAIVIPSDDGSAKLSVTFPNNPNPVEYWVLDTNYESYSLVYSCININDRESQVLSWQLSRSKTLSNAAVNSINAVVSTVDVLNKRYYVNGDNSEEACFYYPEPNPAEPVVFRSRCDANIKAMPNFDAARYLGLWYDIESYPSLFQNGSCNNAFYSLGDNGIVNVLNSQVVGQRLETQSGTAQVISDDGSAKLLVNFIRNVDGIEFASQLEYYVMDTDYETYSVVYSCKDLDDGESKEVYSWKLSRTKDLTADANAKINEVIANITELDQRYYVRDDQSQAGCFYKPDPKEGEPVVFPGWCEEIPVVNNFNLALFEGAWNEIEAYPKDQQRGQCIRHQFTSGTGITLNMESNSVYSTLLETTKGVLSYTSNDNSARMSLTINSGGRDITIPFWILDTDYDNYALAYSCVNIDDYFRRVYSWKLSRTQQLFPAAQTQIDNVIANVQVLDNIYFEPIDQSPEACAFLKPGEDVVVKGQCDSSIPVVTNFDAARYLGKWKLMEYYPSQFQNGDCNEANYSLLSNGSVEVYNTQVENETLKYDIGVASVVQSSDGSAKLTVMFPESPVPIDYWVLATDYDTYSLVYSCINMDATQKRIWSWKLSRNESLTEEAINTINAVVSSVDVLNHNYYMIGDNSDAACFYYPDIEIGPDAKIELPGRCDEAIRGQADFNAELYLGKWYEVRKYPTGDQLGRCARAEYSTINGVVVDVLNTQVVGERLLNQTGTAVVTSTDGTGKLEVAFDVQGEPRTANYYVLVTDYSNYALVYSCSNIQENKHIVSSWILSKQRTGLSALAVETINEYIYTTRGLREDYYLSTSQSDDDCFYVPEVDLSQDEHVVFRGQCEDITGVQNFDIQRYRGWWHEIERYPSSSQTAECTSSQFQASGNEFQVVDISVVDQNGFSDTSTLQATTDGRLRRILSDGQVFDTWVLATDYETYSLLYSCVNIDDEHRRVWSAKHSKSRQLTNAAQNAMTPFIQNNRVLRPEFYREVDQGDDACFYKPEANGEPVILSGKCDETIPVVQDFRAGDYSGTWYQIARYPQQFERGAVCTGARYSVDEDTGTVSVKNWEVVDGELDVIDGTATVISNDGSAKLEVVLPARGEGAEGNVTSPLYVLTTDYTSYALAYSCVNINEFQRRVGVFKLSRTREMPTAGANAIDAYMAPRPELDQQYFIQVQHNDDCLEPASGSGAVIGSVIVILACMLANLFV